ncbi:MAG: TldD/PmbA family protein [Alphaproteobacteria bacterium]|nr:MAG: TldD/PmbA family protein [Alphaproteobacteria bacterium]
MEAALLARASDLVERARRAGADAADAVATSERSLGVSVRLGRLEDVERAESRAFGLRVLLGRKQAVASCTEATAEAFDALVARALAMARAAPDDPCAGLAEPHLLARHNDPEPLELLDPSELDEAGLEARALAAEDAARAVPGVTNSGGAGASQAHLEVALATSTGFAGSYRGSHFSLSVSVLAERDGTMQRDYDFTSARHLADLEAAQEVGRRAGERTVRRLGAETPKTARLPVIFEARAARSLLGHFAQAVNGSGIARGTSFLKDRMGEPVFATGVGIVDDPSRPRGLKSRPFDAEGIAGRRRDIVENGVLKSWILDCATARKLGLETTGHASRSVASPPSPAPSNFFLAPGPVTERELIESVSRGIYVTELIGMGVNPVTGDYSRGASGFLIEAGEITQPIQEFTLAGNLKDMFARLLPASNLEFRTGLDAPSCLVEGMTIAGR